MPTTGRVIPFAFAIAAAAGTAVQAADDPAWTPLGPDGGSVRALAHDAAADTLWAGTKAGVFKSTDGGERWQPAHGDLPRRTADGGSWVMALAAAPTGPPTVYASILLRGLFRSEDGGVSWQPAHTGIVGIHAEIILPHPDVAGAVFASSSGGIFRSINGGLTWTPLGRFPTTVAYPTAYALAAVPGSTLGLYVGLSAGILKTTDGGANWTHLATAELGGWSVHVLTADPARAATIYAAATHFTQLSAVWRSDDAGATWSRADSGLPAGERVAALALDGSGRVHAAVFGAGVFTSADRGASWTLASSALPSVVARTLVPDPVPGGAIYAAGDGPGEPGVFASADGGESWAPRNRGLAGFELEDVVIDPRDSNTLYVRSTSRGVLKSVDRGASWQPANTGLGPDASWRSVLGLAIDPQDSRILYAALYQGVFRSIDGGAHWTQRGQPASGPVYHLDVDPERPGWLLAGTGDGLYRSVDGGATWATVPGELGNNMEIGELVRHPSSTAVLYATATELFHGHDPPDMGVFTSLDRGATWSRVTDFYLGPLAPDPRSASALWACAGELVVRSTDGGRHWSTVGELEVGELSFGPTALLADPLVPDRLFAALGNGVQRSDDGGATWSAWDEGLLHHGARGLAADPGSPGRLYVATAGGGLATRLTTATTCAAGPSTLCLSDGRFRVEVAWKDFAGGSGSGTAMPLTADTGAFWFFADSNLELVVKVLDGRGLNGRYWVFYGSLTSVEFTLTVTDTSTGQRRTYHNPSGTMASVADTDAF